MKKTLRVMVLTSPPVRMAMISFTVMGKLPMQMEAINAAAMHAPTSR